MKILTELPLLLLLLLLPLFSSAQSTGGTITYTDASGLNPRSSSPYVGGYTVHTFLSSDTFKVTRDVATLIIW